MDLIYMFLIFVCGLHNGHASRIDAQVVQPMEDEINSVILPSSYSASSVYQNHEDSAAKQAHLDVFSIDDTPRAWCPSQPVKDERREWLQVEFNETKVVRMLVTKGRGPKSGEFVPSFYMQYQRDDGHWHDYVWHNGESLIPANNAPDVQSKPIELSPVMVARRFRVFPYDKTVSRSMCFKLAIFGHSFNSSVVDYKIPEGDVYRSADGIHAASINDSSYDGMHLPAELNNFQNMDPDQPRALLQGGLGTLMDRDYYLGNISSLLQPPYSAPHQMEGLPNQARYVVGWFCRSGLPPSSPSTVSCQSRNVTLTFRFSSVQQFSRVRIHALNSHKELVSIFRRAVIQFSIGGKLYDKYAPQIVYEHQRDTINLQPRWVDINLENRVGQYVAITLLFDFDWIVLSEIAFFTTAINEVIEEEKIGSGIHQSIPSITPTNPPTHKRDNENESLVDINADLPPDEQTSSRFMNFTDAYPLLIGLICITGLIVFLVIVVFMYRIHNSRRLRIKKMKKLRQAPISSGCQSSNLGCSTLDALPGTTTVPPTYCLANSYPVPTSTMPPKLAPMNQNSINGVLAFHLLQQQAAQNYDSSLSFASHLSSLMVHPSGMAYIDPYADTVKQQHQNSSYSVDLSRQQSQHQKISPLLVTSTATSPTSAVIPSCGFIENPLLHAPLNANGFYPPPPDQPLPPLPPATPVSYSDTGKRQSTINPYAASSLNGFMVDDAGMVTSTHTDGSLAEYASASLINGMPVRPPSIGGMPTGYNYPVQDNIITSTANSPLLLIANPSLNGVPSAYRPVVLPSGQTGYIAAYPAAPVSNGDIFPQNQAYLAMNSSHTNQISNSFNQQPLIGSDFQKRSANVFSSDTLKSIDTLPRDLPGTCFSKADTPQFDSTDVFENKNIAPQR